MVFGDYVIMNNDSKKDLIIGMLYALSSYFKHQFIDDQRQTYNTISSTIDEIYYPKKDLSIPTPRGIEK